MAVQFESLRSKFGPAALDVKIGHETRRPHCPAPRPSSAFTAWPVTEPSAGCNRSPHAQAVAENDTSSRHFSRPTLPLPAPLARPACVNVKSALVLVAQGSRIYRSRTTSVPLG